jgi:hypothetical protein
MGTRSEAALNGRGGNRQTLSCVHSLAKAGGAAVAGAKQIGIECYERSLAWPRCRAPRDERRLGNADDRKARDRLSLPLAQRNARGAKLTVIKHLHPKTLCHAKSPKSLLDAVHGAQTSTPSASRRRDIASPLPCRASLDRRIGPLPVTLGSGASRLRPLRRSRLNWTDSSE